MKPLVTVRNVSCAVHCCVTPAKDEVEGIESSENGAKVKRSAFLLEKILRKFRRHRDNANEEKNKPSSSTTVEEG